MATVTEYDLGEAQIHDVLSNERRKRTLDYLKQEREEVTLRTLADRIAEAEAGQSPPPRRVRKSVYNSLHQTHLPKLDDLDIIEYDDDRKVISIQPRARTVDLYMEVVTPYGITWSMYYQALGVVALMTIIADQLGAFMLGGDYPVVIAGFFLVLIAASTAYRLWSNRWLQLHGLLQE